MCGIIGYIGKKQALPILIEGLRRESYRGYDSSGIVVFDSLPHSEKVQKIHQAKAVGPLEALEKKIKGQVFSGTVGLGHNRWATHGKVTQKNAHPHADCRQNIFVVHNGIIENHQVLKEVLQKKGHVFLSETDTEVLSHLIESYFTGNLEQAVVKALLEVRGAYAVAVIAKTDPQKIVAARLSAPLVICKTNEGGLVASDPVAMPASHNLTFLDDGELAIIKQDSLVVSDLKHNIKQKSATRLSLVLQAPHKGKYAHFMLKEIFEHPESILAALKGRLLVGEGRAKLGGLEAIENQLNHIEAVSLIACGGSSYAALVGEYLLEEYAGLPTKVEVGSEFRYKKPVFDKKTLYIFISQSGETADTLAALREAKRHGVLTLGIVNVPGSTLAREVQAGVYTHSGPEIAVASTKTFSAQITVLCLITLFLSRQRQLSKATGQKIARALLDLPKLADQILKQHVSIKKIAIKYKKAAHVCVIGRKNNYPIALEGALKLKEVAYVHAEGIEGGELKHGYLSLITKDFPTIAICPRDSVYDKMVSNIQEVRARGGKVIALATQGDREIQTIADQVIYLPKSLEIVTPLLATVALHLFAYYLAQARGCPIDKPRNLAKSVTVE